ncbi:hypothetical protein BY458DRAFT_514767 [Sporodiniella umbellata]|nr:hypothetical protein BY458DRAFT_514767 [Sporodiniella umbellata]
MNPALTLPPISTLLGETPRIIVQQAESPHTQHSPPPPFDRSPLLSPISYASSLSRSPASSLARSPSPVSPIYPLPPIHGDDPPRAFLQHRSEPFPSPSPPVILRPHTLWNRRHSYKEEEKEPDVPFTQIILSESGQAILKRRRGRPPNMKPYMEGDGKHWTFLTPTVWDVNHEPPSTPSPPSEDSMHGAMAAFTSASMDRVLQMPRKKRGRKPKSHIEGHSCFVWKDIPASKRNKK